MAAAGWIAAFFDGVGVARVEGAGHVGDVVFWGVVVDVFVSSSWMCQLFLTKTATEKTIGRYGATRHKMEAYGLIDFVAYMKPISNSRA